MNPLRLVVFTIVLVLLVLVAASIRFGKFHPGWAGIALVVAVNLVDALAAHHR